MSDSEGEYYETSDPEIIRYNLQVLDIVGIGLTWAANVLLTTAHATQAVAREVYAAANDRRISRAEDETMSRSDSQLLEWLESKDES